MGILVKDINITFVLEILVQIPQICLPCLQTIVWNTWGKLCKNLLNKDDNNCHTLKDQIINSQDMNFTILLKWLKKNSRWNYYVNMALNNGYHFGGWEEETSNLRQDIGCSKKLVTLVDNENCLAQMHVGERGETLFKMLDLNYGGY